MSAFNPQIAAEPERYEFREGPIHHFGVDRRDFFRLLGAGIAVFAVAAKSLPGQETASEIGFHREALPKEISAWLHVGEDGRVTAFTGKAEIGQNIRTSLAQSVADELRVPFASVRMVMADTALTPFDAGTFGSRTTPTMTPQLRRVAEAAREIFVAEAAKLWKVAPEKLVAADAQVKDPATGRSATYGELARGKALAQELPAADPITPPADWTVAGKPIPKVGARDFVTGKHQYTPDLRPASVLRGKILRPPSFGATLTTFDSSAAQSMKDVTIVRDGDFIGATAPTESQAQAALDAIRAQWKEIPQISNTDLFDYLKKNALPPEEGDGKILGSVDAALARAPHRFEASYTVAYIAHCPLEPRAAVAEWSADGKLTVWTGSQRPFAVRDALAYIFHIPEGSVRVIIPDTGSAYGGKHTGDAAIEAARLARTAGKPVKVVWTREEEFTWAYFRPAGLIEVKSGVLADGKLSAWEHHNYNSGSSGIETPYEVPNQRIQFHSVKNPPLRSGSYRGLAATANFFARETHMDSAAHDAGIEPLEFRLKNNSDARLRGVFEAAAKSFGWPRKKEEPGQGFGIAGGTEKGSYVATCAEVAADTKTGSLRVVRLVTAFECGAIVNPDGLRNQVVGANIQALGGALFEAVDFENGRILNPRFSRYRVPRFRDIPDIEAVLLDRKDIPSAGAGETPIMAVAPAVGNAVFDATGIRLRSMPLVPRSLKS